MWQATVGYGEVFFFGWVCLGRLVFGVVRNGSVVPVYGEVRFGSVRCGMSRSVSVRFGFLEELAGTYSARSRCGEFGCGTVR
jgi:hypothetical protein